MTPRAEFPEEEPECLISKRELQRSNKESLRRARHKPEPSALAEELRRALWLHRQFNDLSQQQLAELLGVKQPQIARLESGFVEPSLATLKRISERLGIDFTIEVKSGNVEARVTRPGSRPA